MNIFFALRMFREMRYNPYCCVIITDNLEIHNALTIAILLQSTKFITSFYYIYTKMDNEKKGEIVWINTGVNTRRREGGFMDINQRKLQLLPPSISMHIQDGEEPYLSLSAVGKTEK